MTQRERSASGQYVETVGLNDVLGVFNRVDGPVITSSDVADALECTTEAARRKLTRLSDRGQVDKRKTGRTVVYWRVDERGHTAPRDGQQHAENTPAPEPDPSTSGVHNDAGRGAPAGLDAVDFPGDRDHDECAAAVSAARDYIQNHGGATKTDLVESVMPDYPLGYDVDAALAKTDAGDRYRGSWWRKIVKPGLKALDDVKTPPQGASTWRFTGDVGEDSTAGGVYDPTEEF